MEDVSWTYQRVYEFGEGDEYAYCSPVDSFHIDEILMDKWEEDIMYVRFTCG